MDWFATIKRYFDMGIYKIEPEEPLYIGNFASLARFLQISSKKSQENNIKQSKRPVNRRRYFYALTLWGLFEMDAGTITALISVAAAIFGIFLGLLGRSRTIRQDTAIEAGNDARLHTDMEYIKRGIDDVRIEQKAQGQRFDSLAERVTRVEESAKQAHKRLDRIEE